MKAEIQGLMIFLSLMTGVALAAPAGAADQSALNPRAPNEGVGARAAKPGTSEDSAQSRSVISGPPLSLYHGEVQVLDLANVVRIAVGNGEVLRANVVASNQVVLIGESAGTTWLRVSTRNGTQFTYEVNVRTFDVSQILRDVQELLAGEPGISARQVGGHVVIEGDYSGARTASRLEALLKIYPQIVSTVAKDAYRSSPMRPCRQSDASQTK